ncbi:MAG: hypothetical protein IPK50_20650 [Fibrobacterota bacterium]|nr:hypothetical protein [Fibrobacterota bacterium]QQS04664.1 MAG: hypothetical protein IPK50_20650 [Fibrobacterota bacterium]
MRTFLALLASLAFTAQAGITSSYTNMETDCQDAFPESELHEGSDMPKLCKGPKGYYVHEWYAAVGSFRNISQGKKGETLLKSAIAPDNCPEPVYGKMLEWRQRDGAPFAVIQRVTCYEMPSGSQSHGKRISETLQVRELHGAQRQGEVEALRTPNANVRARELADKY